MMTVGGHFDQVYWDCDDFFLLEYRIIKESLVVPRIYNMFLPEHVLHYCLYSLHGSTKNSAI